MLTPNRLKTSALPKRSPQSISPVKVSSRQPIQVKTVDLRSNITPKPIREESINDIKPRVVDKMNTTTVDLKFNHEPKSFTILPEQQARSRISARTPAQGATRKVLR